MTFSILKKVKCFPTRFIECLGCKLAYEDECVVSVLHEDVRGSISLDHSNELSRALLSWSDLKKSKSYCTSVACTFGIRKKTINMKVLYKHKTLLPDIQIHV